MQLVRVPSCGAAHPFCNVSTHDTTGYLCIHRLSDKENNTHKQGIKTMGCQTCMRTEVWQATGATGKGCKNMHIHSSIIPTNAIISLLSLINLRQTPDILLTYVSIGLLVSGRDLPLPKFPPPLPLRRCRDQPQTLHPSAAISPRRHLPPHLPPLHPQPL